MNSYRALFLLTILIVARPVACQEMEGAKHGFADSDGVKIHYVTMGKGPLVVLIHGFPDYWYTWRKQMPELAKNFQVVAIDQRGYNKSDQPKGVANYAMPKLVGDVAAVIKHFERKKAVIVGHDWGGAIGLGVALARPHLFARLVLLNTGAFPPPYIPWRIRACRIPILGQWGVRGMNLLSRAALRMAVQDPNVLRLRCDRDYWLLTTAGAIESASIGSFRIFPHHRRTPPGVRSQISRRDCRL